MKNNRQHIEAAVLSRSPRFTFGHMYNMHKYWSKKSPDVVAAYIENYTKPGDVVLDPFCGSGITACEAVRLGRRAIAIDINPMATFITRLTLTPVNLSRLQWAFHDVKSICEKAVSELFVTTCCLCHKNAVIEFVVRDGDVPTQIAYKCTCSNKRLFKDPDGKDKSLDHSYEKKKIPLWYPSDVLLPVIRREKFQYLHELFTKRNLIALSTILNAIEKQKDLKIREMMKLSFTAALDKCSRLKPLSYAKGDSPSSLQQGWTAVRFYAPRMWQEVNPWHAFERSFKKVYKGKQESNAKLKDAIVGSSYEDLHKGRANAVILTGSADTILTEQLPERSVHYVLTDPPFGSHIQYLSLSTFWGAWLRFNFNYERELVENRYQGKTIDDYERLLGEILKSIRKVTKPNKYIHIFYQDIRGPYLHKLFKLMSESNILPERVLYQPPPSSFGSAIRIGKGHYGSYIVRGKAITKRIQKKYLPTEDELQKKIAGASKIALGIREGSASVNALLRSIYQRLSGREILAFAKHSADEFLKESIKEFALMNKTQTRLIHSQMKSTNNHDIKARIRAALLDAKSLYINEEIQKNQIYQRVLYRFQEDGITIEDVRTVDNTISNLEIKEHRKQRLPELLHLFGKVLNFKSRLMNEPDNGVIWEAKDNVRISLQVTDKAISVKAAQAIPGGDIASEVGTISDKNLENALFTWCQENPSKGDNLIKKLNPMEKSTLPSSSPEHHLLKVLDNRQLCPEHYLITLEIPKGKYMELKPGQFFHVICDPDGEKTLTDDDKERGYALTLRRPFSVHRVHYANFDRRLLATPTIIPYEIKQVIRRPVSKIDILYKVVGNGTKNLTKVPGGRFLDVIGPIGNGFDIEKVDAAVILAGGIGVAPLVALAERLRYLGSKIFLYFGALRKELFRPILSRSDSAVDLGYANGTAEFLELINNEFKEIGAEEVKVCTDDGSLGEKALVTEILERDIKSGSLPSRDLTIYACGPSEMVKAVSGLAYKYKMFCQVLLEERMACGIGACFSCTCKIRSKNGKVERKRVCIDGPVFNSKDIIWQD